MKKNTTGKRVVFVQQGGMGNIEQAIFILKKDVEKAGDDYILEEAKKIVDDFVSKNGVKVKKDRNRWILPVAAVSLLTLCLCIYFLL